MKLERPRTIREVALMAGWTYQRMHTHLLRMNEQTHGMLLKPVGGKGTGTRYVVYLAALRRCAPDMFDTNRDIPGEVDELQERVHALEVENKLLVSRVGQLSRKLELRRVA